jgi:translation elongation factor EF-G
MKVEVVTPEDYMGDIIGDLILEEVKLKKWKIEVTQRLFLQ